MRKLFGAVITTLALSACEPAPPPESKAVPSLASSKELVVLVRNGSTSFYVDQEGKYAGLEYDLVTRFAEEIGVKVRFEVVPRYDEIFPKLAAHEAHLAVGVLKREAPGISYGPDYQPVQPVLVYHAENDPPKTLTDAIGQDKLVMVAAQHVPAIGKQLPRGVHPNWHADDHHDTEELVEKVAQGLIDYAVVDAHGAKVAKHYYPDVDIAMEIGKPQSLAWAITHEEGLQKKVNTFFDKVRKDGTLSRLLDRYYGHSNRLQQVDAAEFLSRRLTILPKYRHLFIEAGEKYGIDWRMLAALGYQESHWDPYATSPFGVRGIMMLTTNTADLLGVDDRLDPKQSIMGGAKYLAKLKELIPARIAEPDRTWLAFASYNIGSAHLEDARILAARLKRNPDSWTDLKATLPLLRNAEYFSTLKYGYARGGETVIFVENLRSYYDILARFEPPAYTMFPPFNERVSVANPEGVRLSIDAPTAAPAH
ncbi:membrane-bound lytic murein transglycosylase MltF [Parachitinimonas caeni]|uniref:Membrane-bound lytic murein transglycosylase F n=1 Tax=Parachitinimonas caeni TaxID=3031301 RepID=A0ABT7DZK4_9NEIS|nr:membrane-bound lytic murein transglycosylase MltF [Parachitinimonas caeni]MDK2125495.1 membrane-bound lytic murein transglycosylase MltF [Parachitinimonas caeni]